MFENFLNSAMNACQEVYGTKVIYTKKNNNSEYLLDGIFDESFSVVESDGEVAFETKKPAISFAKKNLKIKPEEYDTIKIENTDYEVISVQDEDISEVTLILMKA